MSSGIDELDKRQERALQELDEVRLRLEQLGDEQPEMIWMLGPWYQDLVKNLSEFSGYQGVATGPKPKWFLDWQQNPDKYKAR